MMASPVKRTQAGALRLKTAAGKWTVAATVLGSGAVFLEGSVVTVALPSIARDLGLGLSGLQWVMNGYLLTLSALMLLGGALGDRFSRRRVFIIGSIGFSVSSALCALAPTPLLLVLARLVQGIAGALLVPNSLALLETSFASDERGQAIGHWAAWSAASTAGGPLLGGWVVDAGGWRWTFAVVVPVAAAAAWIASRHAPGRGAGESKTGARIDYTGALLATLGLLGIVGALMVSSDSGASRVLTWGAAVAGALLLATFVAVERRTSSPLLPLEVFRVREFVGANAVTLLVYAALGGLFFLLMPQLQNVLGYDALEAGAALLPVNIIMLVGSPRAGALVHRIGARPLMTTGAVLAGAGMLLFGRVHGGAGYVGSVLPAAAVFGIGLTAIVTPLTAVVLGSVDDRLVGVASAVNNAVARVAALLATAALPLAAGLDTLRGPAYDAGFSRAMRICAGLCALGALVAWLTIGRTTARRGHAS